MFGFKAGVVVKQVFRSVLGSEDGREGASAFVERRRPQLRAR